MTRKIRTHLRQVVTVAALMGLAAAPAAHADLAVQHDSTIVTETAGNGNGVAEPGDTLAVTENVVSAEFGATLTGVSGTLSTSFADATVGAAGSAYPDLAFGVPAGNTAPFTVVLSNTMECGVSVPLTVALQASTGSANVPFEVPTGSTGAFSAYDSTDVPRSIPDGDALGYSSNLTIAGPGGRVKDLRVRIGKITHTYDADLTLTLISPDGRSVKLVGGKGGSGDNFVDTVFADGATASITSTTAAPFTGTFRPAQPLSTFDGAPLSGNWTLKVVDSSPGDIGTIDAWGLDAAPAVCAPPPAPAPPHDCGLHNGSGAAVGLDRKPQKDKPCKT